MQFIVLYNDGKANKSPIMPQTQGLANVLTKRAQTGRSSSGCQLKVYKEKKEWWASERRAPT